MMRQAVAGISAYFGSKPVLYSKRENTARCYYSIWMRHIAMLHKNGITVPRTLLELGPGESLGFGICALLSGAKEYYAIDIERNADLKRDESITDEIAELFRTRADIPGDGEFPLMHPKLEAYSFPKEIISDNILKKTLKKSNIEQIKQDLKTNSGRIKYGRTYQEAGIKNNSINAIFSQSALEFFGDMPGEYARMRQALKTGGIMSHMIDFKSMMTSNIWNGHLAYGKTLWRIISKYYHINRLRYGDHISILEKTGFSIRSFQKSKAGFGIPRRKLAREFEKISNEDLKISDAHIISVKNS